MTAGLLGFLLIHPYSVVPVSSSVARAPAHSSLQCLAPVLQCLCFSGSCMLLSSSAPLARARSLLWLVLLVNYTLVRLVLLSFCLFSLGCLPPVPPHSAFIRVRFPLPSASLIRAQTRMSSRSDLSLESDRELPFLRLDLPSAFRVRPSSLPRLCFMSLSCF